jgi:hypothetical protein
VGETLVTSETSGRRWSILVHAIALDTTGNRLIALLNDQAYRAKELIVEALTRLLS